MGRLLAFTSAMATPGRTRVAAWLSAAFLLAGSLAAYDARLTLLASVVGAVVIALVQPRSVARRATDVAAALLLSSLTWAMTLVIGPEDPDVTLLAVSLVPFGLGIVTLLAQARPRHGLLALPAFVTVTAAIIWLAFGTSYGHFWLNVGRLEALADSLAATPAIRSLSVGIDYRGERGFEFDADRSINNVLVTHHPSQARPDQQQPKIYVEDELRALGVPRERYDAIRRLMTRSNIGSVAHDPANGQVSMIRVGFYNEWNSFLIFVPGSGPFNRDWAVLGSPKQHWFWVSRQ